MVMSRGQPNHCSFMSERQCYIRTSIKRTNCHHRKFLAHSRSSWSKVQTLQLEVSIQLRPGAKLVRQPPRKVSYPFEEAVDEEFERLLNTGIIEKVDEYSECQSPVVVVEKMDGATDCV